MQHTGSWRGFNMWQNWHHFSQQTLDVLSYRYNYYKLGKCTGQVLAMPDTCSIGMHHMELANKVNCSSKSWLAAFWTACPSEMNSSIFYQPLLHVVTEGSNVAVLSWEGLLPVRQSFRCHGNSYCFRQSRFSSSVGKTGLEVTPWRGTGTGRGLGGHGRGRPKNVQC